MGILDLLFGEKIIRQDDFFGKIESEKTRKKDIAKSLSWSFNKKIGSFKNETYIILEGNYNNINPSQKVELKYFIENFDSVYSFEVDKLIESESKFSMYKNWRNNYYISFICPLLDSNTNFEINFEPINEKTENGYFSVELINRIVKNIETI
ncbi:hypothetical protein [uncultured Flavobacterium sp.]|uniref:hypothetical protein n=1 Tax=uncultured Flavobacterium sp. TaxID=165435 RepID=UPI0030ECAB4E|tara:strand:- start:758 stop:1213 length:456 start_codon:yes stop_codon:yes gene_type:complete